MGLFDDLGVDWDEIEENTGFSNPPDGWHNFEVVENTLRQGTSKDPNVTKYVITFDLGEAGRTSDWFTVAESGEITDKARKSLGYLKARLSDLGVDSADFDPEETDLVGITGSLQLKTNAQGFQRIYDVTVDGTSDEPEPEPESDAEIKKRVQANRAARSAAQPAAAKAAPARRPAARPKASADEENPFERGQ